MLFKLSKTGVNPEMGGCYKNPGYCITGATGQYYTTTYNDCLRTDANHTGCTCGGQWYELEYNTCTKSDANHTGCSCSGSYSVSHNCSKTDANHDGCSVSGTWYTYSPN